MAYEKVTGTIEALNRTGKGFKLDDGEWYSAFKAAQLQNAGVGDTIVFDMEPNDSGGKTFFNVKGDVEFVDDDGGTERKESAGASARGRREPAAGRGAGRGREGAGRARDDAPRPAARGGGGGAGSGGNDPRQVSIVRQSSVAQVVSLIGHLDSVKADFQEYTLEEAVAAVIEAARGFEAYGTSTD